MQQISYRGQQRHELKVSDARILLGRVRQKALRLLQTTKVWKDSGVNGGVRVLIAGGAHNDEDSDDDEDRFATSLNDDNGTQQDQNLMEDYIPKKEKKRITKKSTRSSRKDRSKNNFTRKKTPMHKKDQRRRQQQNIQRRKKSTKNFLPTLGGSVSVPELNHQQHSNEEQPYMSSSFDLARQPFMKNSLDRTHESRGDAWIPDSNNVYDNDLLWSNVSLHSLTVFFLNGFVSRLYSVSNFFLFL